MLRRTLSTLLPLGLAFVTQAAAQNVIVTRSMEPLPIDRPNLAAVAIIGDVDGDGVDDAAFPADDSNGDRVVAVWSVLRQDIISVIDVPSVPSGNSDWARVVQPAGDRNGDGIPDVAVSFGDAIVAFSGTTGSEIGRTPLPQSPSTFTFVTLDDVDGDAVRDFFVGADAYLPPGSTGQGAFLTISAGAGTVLHGPHIYHETRPAVRANVDLDGDGLVDPVAWIGGTRIRAWSGATGARHGTFTDPAVRWSPLSTAGGSDLTGDGRPDLAIGIARSDIVVIVDARNFMEVGRSAPPAPVSMRGSNGSFGTQVVLMNDSTGDGLPELAVGEPNYNGGSSIGYRTGRISLIEGGTFQSLAMSWGPSQSGTGGFLVNIGDTTREGNDDVASIARGREGHGLSMLFTLADPVPAGLAVPVGLGCTSTRWFPTLHATPPVIGRTLEVHGLFLDPGTTYTLWFSPPGQQPRTLAPNCLNFIGALMVPIATVRSDSNGFWSASFGITRDPSLVGFRGIAQLHGWAPGSPAIAEASNAVVLIIGAR